VQAVFAANRTMFETIEVAGVPFDHRPTAISLYERLCDGRAEFPVPIPENPEILEEAADSGYFGLVTRCDVPPEMAEALFADGVGDFVGPVAYDGRFWVFRLLLKKRAELNKAVYEYCEALLADSS
jgi:hypothetical protein